MVPFKEMEPFQFLNDESIATLPFYFCQTPLVHHDEFYLKAKGYPITIVIKFQSIPSFILINTNFLTAFVLGKFCLRVIINKMQRI